ncbi:MAG: hypothetical protein KKB13_21245 [Chloroflexi bacterium]|nr:hypothetical protein [Chloroflexota bacterium]
MAGPLEKEFDYYVEHQDELVKSYADKYIVLKNETVLGAYDSLQEAIRETTKTEELGTFLVQKVEPGKTNYTQVFHSRIAVT